MKALRSAIIAIALAWLADCAAVPAFAQDPAASPAPALRYGISTWSGMAVGRADTSVRFGAQVDVAGPIVLGDKPAGDLGLRLSIDTLPNKGPALEDLASWGNVLEISGWGGRRIGQAQLGAQLISTSIVGEGRFATSFRDASDATPRRRFYRAYGLGLQTTLHLPDRDAYFRLTYGRDEAVGERGVGQLNVSGELPVVAGVRIYARAGLGLGRSSVEGAQADYIVAGVGKPW
jgi:hypothetical protein